MPVKLTYDPHLHLKTEYLDDPAVLKFGRYPNREIGITAYSPTGEPLAKITTNLEDYGVKAERGKFVLKDCRENEGMLQSFIEAGFLDSHELIPVPANVGRYYLCEPSTKLKNIALEEGFMWPV